jgi:EAL domain-containing protein (putative c-di-GMP-specific phosphodiesterase class I)
VQEIEAALPGASRRGELDLFYQPIVDLSRDRPSAVEALLRWRHPTLGTLPPDEVIPVAVRTGVIGEIGHWVFQQATAQLASWRRDGRDLSMAVNVTPAELGGLGPELASMLAAHRVPADRLVLEIAESYVEDGAAFAEHAAALRLAGVRTALDAFGAEPASLANLRRLPIDMVKLGQPFFGDGRSPVPAPRPAAEVAHLVDLLVGVGRRLGIEVVAHGLEEPEQLEVARSAGCRMGQGHLFAHPAPAEHTEAYLDGFR